MFLRDWSVSNTLNSPKPSLLGLPRSVHTKKTTHTEAPCHLGPLNVPCAVPVSIGTYVQHGLIIQILLPGINSQIYI